MSSCTTGPILVGRPRGSAGQERDHGQHDPDAGAPQRPAGLPVGPLLALYPPVVVQQVGLAGAVPAMAGVEHPRLVLVFNQHHVLLAWMPRRRWPDPATGHDRPGAPRSPSATNCTPIVRVPLSCPSGLLLRVVDRRAFNERGRCSTVPLASTDASFRA